MTMLVISHTVKNMRTWYEQKIKFLINETRHILQNKTYLKIKQAPCSNWFQLNNQSHILCLNGWSSGVTRQSLRVSEQFHKNVFRRYLQCLKTLFHQAKIVDTGENWFTSIAATAMRPSGWKPLKISVTTRWKLSFGIKLLVLFWKYLISR